MASNITGKGWFRDILHNSVFIILIHSLCRKSPKPSSHTIDTFIMALQAGMLVSSWCSCVSCCYLSTHRDCHTHPYTSENKAVEQSIYLMVTACAQTETDWMSCPSYCVLPTVWQICCQKKIYQMDVRLLFLLYYSLKAVLPFYLKIQALLVELVLQFKEYNQMLLFAFKVITLLRLVANENVVLGLTAAQHLTENCYTGSDILSISIHHHLLHN